MAGTSVRSDAAPQELFSEDGIPTVARILALPAWGAVAFAARCARRVQPVLFRCWPDGPRRDRDLVQYCVRMADGRAGFSLALVNTLIHDLTIAVNEANALRQTGGHYAANRYQSALDAALLTAYAVKCALRSFRRDGAENACDAARQACAAVKPNHQIVRDIRSDFSALLEEAGRWQWDDASLEPISFYAALASADGIDYDDCE